MFLHPVAVLRAILALWPVIRLMLNHEGVPEMVPLVCVKMGISQNCIPFESNTWWYSNHRQNIYTGQTDVGRPSLSGGKSLAKVLIVKVSSYKHGFVSYYCCYELSWICCTLLAHFFVGHTSSPMILLVSFIACVGSFRLNPRASRWIISPFFSSDNIHHGYSGQKLGFTPGISNAQKGSSSSSWKITMFNRCIYIYIEII